MDIHQLKTFRRRARWHITRASDVTPQERTNVTGQCMPYRQTAHSFIDAGCARPYLMQHDHREPCS